MVYPKEHLIICPSSPQDVKQDQYQPCRCQTSPLQRSSNRVNRAGGWPRQIKLGHLMLYSTISTKECCFFKEKASLPFLINLVVLLQAGHERCFPPAVVNESLFQQNLTWPMKASGSANCLTAHCSFQLIIYFSLSCRKQTLCSFATGWQQKSNQSIGGCLSAAHNDINTDIITLLHRVD